MSWVYNGVCGEGEQLFLYGLDELTIIAIAEVGAPDRTLE